MILKTFRLYENDPSVTLTAYILDDSPEMLNGKSRPAVLVCPGGAYMFCSDREAEPVALCFASMGYHAFVLRYSVYSNGPAPFPFPGKTPVYEKGVFPGPMREIGMAMLKIREHAEEWHVDPDRIILNGGSAGANNCAVYAVSWNKPFIYEYLNAKPEDLRPAGAVLGYGVYDVYRMQKTLEKLGDRGRIEQHKGFCFAAFGCAEPDEKMLEEASPVFHVTKDTPPMFLWTTREDDVVPMTQTLVMALALEEAGVPCETHIFENGRHGLSLATQASASAKEQIMPDVSLWIGLAQTWLQKHFPLELPEKCPEWVPPAELF